MLFKKEVMQKIKLWRKLHPNHFVCHDLCSTRNDCLMLLQKYRQKYEKFHQLDERLISNQFGWDCPIPFLNDKDITNDKSIQR
jgi:hypothetical protein